MIRRLATLVALLLLATNCTDATVINTTNLASLRTAVLTCTVDGEGADPAQCVEAEEGLKLYVLQGFRSTLMVYDFDTQGFLDFEVQTPGSNGIRLPGQVYDARRGPHHKTVLATSFPDGLVRVSLPDHAITSHELPFVADRVRIVSLDSGDFAYLLSADGTAAVRWEILADDVLADEPEAITLPPEPVSDLRVHHAENKLVTVSTDGKRLWVADLEEFSWTAISLSQACNDGLDNDDDGFVDGVDPDCTSRLDGDEATDDTLFECGDGIDNDDDGLTDLEDGGCVRAGDNSEHSENSVCSDGLDNDGDGTIDPTTGHCPDNGLAFESHPCSDGLDNDGDGLVDDEDEDCVGDEPNEHSLAAPCGNGTDENGNGVFDAPGDPTCADPTHTSEALPRCSDGLDNDGDGQTDTDDINCYGAMDNDESDEASMGSPVLAVHPQQSVVYVLRPSQRDVLAIDLEAGAVLTAHEDNAYWTQRQLQDAPLGALPVDLVFHEIPADDDGESQLVAYLALQNGQLLPFDPVLHIFSPPDTSSSSDPTLSSVRVAVPSFTLDDETQDLSFVLPADIPHFGSVGTQTVTQTIDDEEITRVTYTGVELKTTDHETPTERWTVTSGGIIPATERFTGILRQANREFHDPGARFCDAGVQPGDILEIIVNQDLSCGALRGDTFEVVIESVAGDTLTFNENTLGQNLIMRQTGDDPQAAKMPALFDGGCIDPEDPNVNYVGLNEDECALVDFGCAPGQIYFGEPACGCGCIDGGLTPQCLAGPLHYRIRVPDDTFLVVGSRSGMLHPLREGAGGCETDAGLVDAHWNSRAYVGEVTDTEMGICPLSSDSGGFDTIPFENPVFSFALVPACSIAGGTVSYVEPIRDVAYTVDVFGGNTPQVSFTAFGCSHIEGLPSEGFLYFVDDVDHRIYTLDPANGQRATSAAVIE